MRNKIIVLISLIVLSLSAHAESFKTRFSDDELMSIFKGEGYSAVSLLKEGAVRIKIDGRSYLILNKKDGDIQAYYSIGGAHVSLTDINEWNKTKRLSRAYLDNDQDPVLEADLLANGGLREKNVVEFFNVFKISVAAFREYIIAHNGPEN